MVEETEGEACDPTIEDCDSLKARLKNVVRESDVLEMGIHNFEIAKKAIESNKGVFDTEKDEKSFDDQIADYDKKISQARGMLKEQDDKLYDGMKKWNLCEETGEEPPVPLSPTPAPEQETSHPSVPVTPPPEQEVSQPEKKPTEQKTESETNE